MNGYIKNIGEVLLSTVSQIEENMTTWRGILRLSRTKVKSNVLYLISVMVLAHLAHMLARGTYWIFNQDVSLSKLHKPESLRQSHIFYDEGEEVKRLQGDMSFTLEITIEQLDEIIEEILGSKF